MEYAIIAFAFLTIIGAFSAWRQSPLYSLKTTFKLLGAFLFIVTVALALSTWLLSSTLSRSPVARGVLAFIAIILVGSGASVLIVRVTDSHVAQLPPSAKLVSFNRHKLYRWIWRLLIFLIINAVAAVALPMSWNWLPIGIGGFVILLCGPMLSILLMMAARNDRGMSAVIADPWAHWEYTPERWTQWAKEQRAWEEAQEAPWKWKGIMGFILFCSALFVIGAFFSGGTIHENEIVVSSFIGFLILMVLVAYWFKRTNFERRYRRLLSASPEAWFGDEGLFCNGQYLPWILSGRYLLRATVTNGPSACLSLIFQSFNGGASILVTQRIPIPDDRTSDLLILQNKLNDRCPTASIDLKVV